jgi:endonuclease G
VAVPAANFKIVVVLEAEQKPAQIGPSTEVIAVLMPNEKGVGQHEWTDFVTSVDALESATGYDFLNAIPEPVQSVIEARVAHL